LRYLLTERERKVIKTLNKDYRRRFSKDPREDKELVYYLGDNATRKCWSGVSKKLPTLRMAGGLMWYVCENRFMTGREKLASLGFPITEKSAKMMGVTQLQVTDPKRCSKIAGNCMHWSCIGIVQLTALASFKLVS